jgi:predicted pyridoxine 5'-phosphate oxidase superfamily flavin-nucleotide-binding protein
MALIEPGIKKLIEANALAFCTVDQAGKPHAIAVAYCKVFDDRIIISNSHIEESIENIKSSPHVSLAVWNKEWEDACVGFELKGTAENQTEGQWLEFVKTMPENEGCDIKSAVVVTVSNIKKLLS